MKRQFTCMIMALVLTATLVDVVQAQTVETLVPAGATWKYDDTDTDLYSANWPLADDTGWDEGPAPLGFGDPHIVTILTAGSPRHTCYFRHVFTVADPSIYESLTLRILRDDGCVVYLNGIEVVRSNMPGGQITHGTWSSAVVGGGDETTYFEFSVDPAVLVAGDNVFAVDVHQCNTTSSDLGFDLELEAVGVDPHSPHKPTLMGPEDGASNVSTSPALVVTVSDPDEDTLDVTFYGRQASGMGGDFTVIVLPDTQKYAESYPDIFTAQTQWIVNNKDTLNIVFVIHEGDIVNVWNSTTQWDRANSSMSLLDAGVVPYSVVPGDHDHYGEDPPGSTEYYEQYFPASRFSGYSWWGGSYAGNYGGDYNEDYPHTNNNNYQLLTIGGQDYIFLSLDFCPSQDEMDWANGILTTYSDRKAILTTHALLDTSAQYYGSGDFWLYPDGSSNPTGDTSRIWYDLIRNHENLQLVLCGHMHGEARRTDNNLYGKPVHQLLANYQGRTNGGNGWLRIMRFVPAENTVYVQTYSPWLDQYETDGTSEFALDFPMSDPFSVIGSDTGVPNGDNASIVWSGLSSGTNYEWFVEVTDPTDRTTVGPVWSFATALTPEASNPNPADGATGVDIDADLNWSPGIDAVSHDVYFGTTDPPTFTQNQSGTTYDPGTLAPSTPYYWRIDEVGPGGTITGDVWSFTTAPVPGQATNPNPANGATDVSINADLNWTAGSNATVHNVYFGTNAAPGPDEFKGSQTAATYDPGELAHGTTYYWVIDEIGPGGVTEGNVWSFTTETLPPLLPWYDDFESGGFAAGGWTTSGNASVSSKAAYSGTYGVEIKGTAWIEKAIDTTGFNNIHVKYARSTKGLDNGEYFYVEWYDGSTWHELESTQVTSWSLADTTCGEGVQGNGAFKVRFRTNASNSAECAYVDNVEITGIPSEPDTDPPAAPTGLVATAGDSQVSLDWADNSEPDLGGYNVYRSTTQGGSYIQLNITLVPTSDYVDLTASNGTTYYYVVTAVDFSSNESVNSTETSATPFDDAPSPPTGLSATPGDAQVTLDWDDNTDTDLAGYNVHRSETEGGPYSQLNGVPVTASDYVDTGLTNGTTYYYVVTAVDLGSNESGNSNEVSATPSSQQKVYVESITMSLQSAGKNWKGVAGVVISPAVSGATVVGNWYLNGTVIQTSATGVTDGSGYTSLTSPPKKATTGQVFTFMVTDVVLSGYVYDSGQGETEGSIDVS